MKRAFFSNSYTPGYGPRIFVPYEFAQEARTVLDPLSCWGGTDKDTGKAKGWEFSTMPDRQSRYWEAITELKRAGFTVDGIGQHNADEVWP